ncbi:tRNA (cytidine(34)-2'-O)-methyltransferase, partial [Staphylococcus pseudintermedius]
HLHLIRPLGFSTDDKMLRRAGLDYWKYVSITYYDNIESFFEQTEGQYFLLTKFGSKNHTSQDFSDVDQNYYFIFGKETTGLPDWVKDKYDNTALRIPMNENVRALNLSNTAAILVYEALRQQNYPNLQ